MSEKKREEFRQAAFIEYLELHRKYDQSHTKHDEPPPSPYDAGFEAGERFGAASIDRAEIVPLDVVLFCPECKAQHIDKAEPDKCESCGHPESEHFGHKFDDPDDIGCYSCGGITKNGCQFFTAWLNPPHKKHRCHDCNHVWKAANVPTNGVAVLDTYGGKENE